MLQVTRLDCDASRGCDRCSRLTPDHQWSGHWEILWSSKQRL